MGKRKDENDISIVLIYESLKNKKDKLKLLINKSEI